MLENKAVTDALNAFAKFVINESRTRLNNDGKGGGDLSNSLGSKVSKTAEGFKLVFEMEDYGKFQDRGVKGANPSKVSPNAKKKGQQAPNSPYRFGTKKLRWNF